MKKGILGLVVMLVFQVCTSELSEIDGVVGDHVDLNGGSDPTIKIPNDQFLGQYFSSSGGTGPISSRIERGIRHDFNSPIKNDVLLTELGAKWSGDFYFASGEYNFSINSDKGIKMIIDDKVVLNETGNSAATVYNINQEMDGVHRIVVEYNLENSTTQQPVEDTTPEVPVEDTTPEVPVEDTTPEVPVEDTTPEVPAEDTTPEVPVEDTTPEVPVEDTTPSDPGVTTDPVVAIDNSTPTVVVDWTDSSDPEIANQTVLKIKLTEGSKSGTYVSSELLGKELKQRIELFKPVLNESPNNLDYGNVYLDSDQIKDGEEDCAPYRIMGETIGGNHGRLKNYATSNGHGKTDIDIGSVWNNGTDDVEIWAIDGPNKLWISGTNASGKTFTHVSGATNTASFTVTTNSFRQMYPPSKNHSLVLKVDGIPKSISTNEYEAVSDIVFEESYEIMDNASMAAWLRANVGNVSSNSELDGTAVVGVTNKIRYTRFGNTLETDFLVLPGGDGLAFADIMFTMGFEMTESINYPNLRAYIPKTTPFTSGANTFDFANIEDVDFLPLAERVNITHARADATGILPDRHLYLLDGVGFAMGFLPIYDADPTVRRTRANNKAMQLAKGGKIYMSAIDDNSQSKMKEGDYFKVTSYKVFFESTSNRTAFYIIDDNEGNYFLYADWHTLPYTDTLNIPLSLVGKTITEIEKSSNVNYTGGVIRSTLEVNINASESYGYLILKL